VVPYRRLSGVIGCAVLAVSACGGMATTASPGGAATATATTGASTPDPVSGVPDPFGSAGTPDATEGRDASGGATPRPTSWPGNAVLAISALGVADNEVRRAINDFNQGVATEDLGLMRRAATGLAEIGVLLPNVERIEVYEPMRSLAGKYRAAISEIAAASRDVKSAIDAGDAEAIGSSSSRLARGLALYAELQPELASWVEQSIEQQRLLIR
jgi:hypothetical protein